MREEPYNQSAVLQSDWLRQFRQQGGTPAAFLFYKKGLPWPYCYSINYNFDLPSKYIQYDDISNMYTIVVLWVGVLRKLAQSLAIQMNLGFS